MWTEEATENLIDVFKNYPILWDNKNRYYKNRSKKMNALKEISELVKVEVVEVERKLNVLITQFRRAHKKAVSMRSAGMSDYDVERNIWYGYKSLLFMADRFDSNQTKYTGIKDETEPLAQIEADGMFESSETTLQSPFHSESDNHMNETFFLMKDSTNKRALDRDEYDLYGEQVALKLKKMDEMTRAQTQHQINCIIHEAEMKVLKERYEFRPFPISTVTSGRTSPKSKTVTHNKTQKPKI